MRYLAVIAGMTYILTAPVQAAEPFRIPFTAYDTHATIEGHNVVIPVSGIATVAEKNDTLEISADITASLGDLQKQIGSIVQTKMNRDDDCNEKLRVHTVDLQAVPPVAVLSAAAHYEQWVCAFGAKTRLFEQNGDVRVSVMPGVADDAVTLSFAILGVDADGALGALLANDLFGGWLTTRLGSMLPRALTVARLRDALPPELKDIPAALSNVAIIDSGNGVPAIRGTLRLTVGPEQVAALLLGLRPRT